LWESVSCDISELGISTKDLVKSCAELSFIDFPVVDEESLSLACIENGNFRESILTQVEHIKEVLVCRGIKPHELESYSSADLACEGLANLVKLIQNILALLICIFHNIDNAKSSLLLVADVVN
jgi:hypothetical protein